MAPSASVTLAGETFELDAEQALSFGRSEECTLQLDADDLGISRRSGELVAEAGHWWLHNRSTSRALELVDDLGFRVVLPPGRRVALEGRSTVVVTGSVRRHALVVEVGEPAVEPGDGTAAPSPGAETAVGTGVLVNEADRQAMAALFEGYLRDFPRHDPNPRTYAEAAVRLEVPRTTVVKRIEYLRTRLTDAGVPNLHGDQALRSLAEYAISTGLLTRDDLQRLPA